MVCDTSEILTIFYYAKIGKTVFFVIVPVLFVILGAIDFAKVVFSGESDDLGIAVYNFMKRVVLAGIIMIMPFFVNLILGLIGFGTYDECFEKATTENIEALRKKELEEWEKEKARREAEEEARTRLDVKTGTHKKSYGGMDYFEIIPPNPKPNMALVIFLHGDGEYSNFDRTKSLPCFKFVESKKAYVGEEFIFIAPHGARQDWISTGIVNKLLKLMDYIIKEYKIDKKRVYITGHSRGAIGVWSIVNRHSDRFAAAVPISGSGGINANNWKYVPTKVFVGSYQDDSWTWSSSRSNCSAINTAGGKCTYTMLNAGHGATPTKAFDKALFKWMLKQKRK